MSPLQYVEFNIKRVGRGYRRFSGKLYQFLYRAVQIGDFSNAGLEGYAREIQEKVDLLRSQGYSVRVIIGSTGESLIYTHGERTQ